VSGIYDESGVDAGGKNGGGVYAGGADAFRVKNLLGRYGIHAHKSMGQNFLADSGVSEKIIRLSGVDGSCGVLEVGPGIGALTLGLSHSAGRVTAVELDEKLLPVLRSVLEGRDNVDIVSGDILKLDIRALVCEKMPGKRLHVCSNLPYNITSPALSKLIGAGVFETMTVMVQREVAGRICAAPGTKEYGAFTVFVNYHSEPETLFDVSPECFYPQPGVRSAVIKLKMRGSHFLQPGDEAVFFKVVRAAFSQRRKTLVNALHAVFGSSAGKDVITERVARCGFDGRARGETLGLEDFIRLSESFR